MGTMIMRIAAHGEHSGLARRRISAASTAYILFAQRFGWSRPGYNRRAAVTFYQGWYTQELFGRR